MKKVIGISFFISFLLGIGFISSAQNHIFLKVSSKRLHDQKVVSSNYELLVNCDNGEMIIHYAQPEDFYVFTNKLGEMQAYYPDKNEVIRQRNILFSSSNDPVYQFFTTQGQDLGLSQIGFRLDHSELDGEYLVSEWNPPADLIDQILKVKLVQESYLPVFVSYTAPDEKVKQKIYFSEWNMDCFAIFPQRITQIDYLPNNDSIISKKTYTDLLVGSAAEKRFPSVSIPADAKLIKLSSPTTAN